MGLLSDFGGPFVVVLTSYYLFSFVQSRRAIKRQKKQHACQEPPKYPHRDRILGSDLFRGNAENAKKFRLLDAWTDRFEKHRKTFKAIFQGTQAICTVDPTNLQAITTTNFKNYGIQPMRRAATLPFLGEGVFTMDGAFWEHSRALIRPTFSKTNIANLPAFEINLQKFFRWLPKDEWTVNLKPLLCSTLR